MDDEDPRISSAECAIIRAAWTGQGFIPLSDDQLRMLAKLAAATKASFDGNFAGMTREQALYVRRLRVDQEYTWRAVAATCAIEWDEDWGSNQLAGLALCERAARVLGEDPNTEPWN